MSVAGDPAEEGQGVGVRYLPHEGYVRHLTIMARRRDARITGSVADIRTGNPRNGRRTIARRNARRGWILGLSATAAALAALVALSPIVFGGDYPDQTPQSFLNQAEGGGFNHNLAHQTASPAAKSRALARVKLCQDDAWRASHAAFCPEDGSTNAQVRSARLAAQDLSAAGSEKPDGMWGPLFNVPSTAIHAIVLPTNKVLWISQPKWPAEDETVDGGNAYLWDPLTNTSTSVPPPAVTWNGRDIPFSDNRAVPANLWCAGQTLLADGRVLVVGGNLEYPINNGNGAGHGFKGGQWVMTFDPWTETWTRYQDMDHGRWYPTLTELPDGRVLIVGGWDESGGSSAGSDDVPPLMHNNQDVEVFDPAAAPGSKATTVVSKLPPGQSPPQPYPWPNHEGLGLYPHMFVLPDTTELGAGGHKVLVAGPSKYDSAVIDTQSWIWTDVVDTPDTGQPRLSSDRSWGTAWLEPSGPRGSARVVLLGGSDAGQVIPGVQGTSPPPLATADVLDLNAPDDGWTIDPSLKLNEGRAHFNSVLLPGGGIFTNGGGYGRMNDSLYEGPVYDAELLAPGGTGGWRTVGAEADARTYHSTSVLLPDGRVLSAGDDRDIVPAPVPPGSPANMPAGHISPQSRTAQIWSPPYMFDGARPVVTFAPQRVRYDAPFRIAVQGDPSAVSQLYLMRPAAVTHAVDMSQQAIRLDVTAQADGLTTRTPLNATVAPPGYYMLFALNAQGVPSTATWIRLDPGAPDAPAIPTPAPPAPPTPPGAIPGDAATPATSPTGAAAPVTPRPAPLAVRVPAPRLAPAGTRVRVTQALRSSARATATVTVIPRSGRAVARKVVRLSAGRAATAKLVVPRTRLRGSSTVRVRVVVTDAAHRTRTATHAVRVPAPRR